MKRVSLKFVSEILIVFLLFINNIESENGDQKRAPALTDAAEADWDNVLNGNERILVLFYQSENGASDRIRKLLTDYTVPPGFHGVLKIFQSADAILGEKSGVREYPSIVFYREKAPVVYDGEVTDDEFSHWLLQAQDVATKTLTDDNFEHLTQAITGSTTGDWLVVFYKDSCSSSLIDIETVAVRLKGKGNVAKVNMETNPKLVERFTLTKCPEIIFFRQGTMYRYEMDKVTVKILLSFVQAWYRNMKAEKIPFQPTAFDKVTEDIALFVKKQINGPNGKIILGVTGGVTALVFILFIVCCCCGGKPKQKSQ